MAISKLTKINIIGVTFAITGILSFFAVKHSVTKQRKRTMKSREQMLHFNPKSSEINK